MAFFRNNILLYPLSTLYAFGSKIRNKLFDLNILKSKEYPFPIISVGNLSVGGTGKTPHTEYLLDLLQKENLKTVLLSRGYKRATKGLVIADQTATAQSIGDEPYQMYRKFHNTTVIVDAKRERAIDYVCKKQQPPPVFILDDAFQYRRIVPGLSILLIDSNRLTYKDKYLPLGHLRESAKESSRADIIIVTKCPNEGLAPIDRCIIRKNLNLTPSQSLYFSTYKYGEIYPVFPNPKPLNKKQLNEANASAIIVTGIVSANDLYRHVKKHIGKFKPLGFPDHHFFTKKDWEKIEHSFNSDKTPTKIILVSEKDAARILSDPNTPEKLKSFIYTIPIYIAILHEKEKMFNQQINDYVKKNKRVGRIY